MSVGDPIVIERSEDGIDWQPWMTLHCPNVNKTRSTEYVEAGGEQNASYVTFRVRWNRRLPEVEADTTRHRIVWRGRVFDIRGYDDYQYQHRKVDLAGVSYG